MGNSNEAEIETRLSARDAGWALLTALVVTALYWFTLQGRLNTDGSGMAGLFVFDRWGYHHIAWLPACKFLDFFLDPADPVGIPRLLSVLSGGLGTGLAWIICRSFGATRLGTGIALSMLVVTPALWFWSTTIEIHAFHYFGVNLGACVTLWAPWRRPALALLITALVFPLVYFTHQSAAVLGPGWVLLVQYARSRKAEPFRWRTLIFVVGPVLLGMLVLAMAVTNRVRFGDFGLQVLVENQSDFLEATKANPSEFESGHGILWDELVIPYLFLVLAALPGIRAYGRRIWGQAAIWGMCLGPTVFLLWWGVVSRGGYYLDCVVFFVVFVAATFRRPKALGLGIALLLILSQAWWARRQIDAFDNGWDPESRAEVVAALMPDGGLLFTTVPDVPFIRIWQPEVDEVTLINVVQKVWNVSQGSADPAQFGRQYANVVARKLKDNDRALFDLSYTLRKDDWVTVRSLPYLQEVERLLIEEYGARRVDHPAWPMLLVD